jgi:hypothetical protein
VRLLYLLLGGLSLLLGAIGAVVPLLPTVPFVLLAAFFFARGHPPLEAWLLRHPSFGPHITAWRARGAISRRGKIAALAAFGLSALIGLLVLAMPWALLPAAAALIGGSWVWTRPE